jgi:Ni/Co efflux regulator RcnB
MSNTNMNMTSSPFTLRSVLTSAAVALGLQAGMAMAQPGPPPRHDAPPKAAMQPAQARPGAMQAPQRGPSKAHAPRAATPMHPAPGRHPDAGPRGAGPDHRVQRGDRLPQDYRGKQFVVDDWRGHRLSKPARGQRWVQVGADYALVAIATGVIAQIVLGH